MPFVLQSLDTKLSSVSQRPLCERRLALYTELMRSLGLQYEHTECVSTAIRKLLDFADSELPTLSPSPESNDAQQGSGGKAVVREGLPTIKSWGEVIVRYPRFYLRLSLSLDCSLSGGRYPGDHELPGWVLGPYLQESPSSRSPANSLTLLRPSSATPPVISPGQNKDQGNEQNHKRKLHPPHDTYLSVVGCTNV
jgi:hypothetical protein